MTSRTRPPPEMSKCPTVNAIVIVFPPRGYLTYSLAPGGSPVGVARLLAVPPERNRHSATYLVG